MCCHTQLIFELLVQMRFHHIGQAGLELPDSSDLLALASQSAGIYTHGQLCPVSPVLSFSSGGPFTIPLQVTFAT